MCGAAIGEKNKTKLRDAFYKTSLWCGVFSLLIALGFWAGGPLIIDSLTTNAAIRETARSYLLWAVLMSPLAFASFQLDGLFFAATRGAEIRNAMIVSLTAYLTAVWFLLPVFGNHGLWISLAIFMVVRAATLAFYYPRIEASISDAPSDGASDKA